MLGPEIVPPILSCLWAAVVAALILRASGQRGLLRQLEPASLRVDNAPAVAVIVPARDEADNIGRCLGSLLTQTYPADRLRLLMIDDHSTDATFAIAKAMADIHPQLRVIKAPPLPPRWTGKSHACWSGAVTVFPWVEWICFVDADVVAEPRLLESAIAAAVAEKLDLLSLAPRQVLVSFAERLVIPCGLFFQSFRQDLGKLQSTDCMDATATGQFLLIRASAYDAIGGHKAVADAICEDVALARRIKRAGYRAILQDGQRLVSTRMYAGWRMLWPGLTKNLVEMIGGMRASFVSALVAVLLAWSALIVPFLATEAYLHHQPASSWALPLALAGSGAAFALHIAGTAYFRIPFWYGLLFPLGYTLGAAMIMDSIRCRLCGRVRWKGRFYR